jgi:glycosyltransferase involved in cell wall biosynthesis
VDGCSEDGTVGVAKRLFPSIRVVPQKGSGKGDALIEGFAHCTGDAVVALDADGSMDPGEIATFVAAMEAGFQYVKGSRMMPGGGSDDLTPLRRFGNWVFRSLARVFFGCKYTDLCYGYFAFVRGTVDSLDLKSDGFEIETEIGIKAHVAGLRILEVPSHESRRLNGDSQLRTFRDGWRILQVLGTSLVTGVRRQPSSEINYADVPEAEELLRPVREFLLTPGLSTAPSEEDTMTL